MSLYSLVEKLEFDTPVGEVFKFFTDTDQISVMLTPSIPLKIKRRSTRHIQQGGFFEIEARFLGIPYLFHSHVLSMNRNRHIAHRWRGDWKTAWEQDDYFESISHRRTRVTTCVLYSFPLGFMGRILQFLFLRPLLKYFLRRRRAALCAAFQKISQLKTQEKHKKRISSFSRDPASSALMEPSSHPNRDISILSISRT